MGRILRRFALVGLALVALLASLPAYAACPAGQTCLPEDRVWLDAQAKSLKQAIADGDLPGSPKVSTYAALPTCNAGRKGQLRSINDAAQAGLCVLGGGSGVASCICDGTNWTSDLGQMISVSPSLGGTGDNTASTTGVPIITAGNWTYPTQLPGAQGGTGISTTGLTGHAKLTAGVWSIAALADADIPDTLTIGSGSTVDGAAITNDSVALGTKTSGQLPAAEGGTADNTSATTGVPIVTAGDWTYPATLARSLGGLGANTGAYGTGLLGSDGSNATVDVDTEAELETALGGINLAKTTDNVASATTALAATAAGTATALAGNGANTSAIGKGFRGVDASGAIESEFDIARSGTATADTVTCDFAGQLYVETDTTPSPTVSICTVTGAPGTWQSLAKVATGATIPTGNAACDVAGDLYRQAGGATDLMWLCRTAGTSGTAVWDPITTTRLGTASASAVTCDFAGQTYIETDAVIVSTCVALGAPGTWTTVATLSSVQGAPFVPDAAAAWAVDGGTVNGGANSTSMNDLNSSKKWAVNQFASGFCVIITAGTGASSTCTPITANTATQIQVAAWPAGTPDSTSHYIVAKTNGAVDTALDYLAQRLRLIVASYGYDAVVDINAGLQWKYGVPTDFGYDACANITSSWAQWADGSAPDWNVLVVGGTRIFPIHGYDRSVYRSCIDIFGTGVGEFTSGHPTPTTCVTRSEFSNRLNIEWRGAWLDFRALGLDSASGGTGLNLDQDKPFVVRQEGNGYLCGQVAGISGAELAGSLSERGDLFIRLSHDMDSGWTRGALQSMNGTTLVASPTSAIALASFGNRHYAGEAFRLRVDAPVQLDFDNIGIITSDSWVTNRNVHLHRMGVGVLAYSNNIGEWRGLISGGDIGVQLGDPTNGGNVVYRSSGCLSGTCAPQQNDAYGIAFKNVNIEANPYGAFLCVDCGRTWVDGSRFENGGAPTVDTIIIGAGTCVGGTNAGLACGRDAFCSGGGSCVCQTGSTQTIGPIDFSGAVMPSDISSTVVDGTLIGKCATDVRGTVRLDGIGNTSLDNAGSGKLLFFDADPAALAQVDVTGLVARTNLVFPTYPYIANGRAVHVPFMIQSSSWATGTCVDLRKNTEDRVTCDDDHAKFWPPVVNNRLVWQVWKTRCRALNTTVGGVECAMRPRGGTSASSGVPLDVISTVNYGSTGMNVFNEAGDTYSYSTTSSDGWIGWELYDAAAGTCDTGDAVEMECMMTLMPVF